MQRKRSENPEDLTLVQRAGQRLEDLGGRMAGDASRFARAEDLIVQVGRISNLLGFGKRIVVPADQIHIVNGGGRSSLFPNIDVQVFGSQALIESPDGNLVVISKDGVDIIVSYDPNDSTPTRRYKRAPGVYWANSSSEITALKTNTFMISVSGTTQSGSEGGLFLFDNEKTPFRAEAHIVASLDVTNAIQAAAKVGKNPNGLINEVRELTQAKLYQAAATMSLNDIIEQRDVLANKAKENVDGALRALGYKLSILAIESVSGEVFDLYIAQAKEFAIRDTTVQTNEAVLITLESQKLKEQREAELSAATLKKTQEERLAADRRVQELELQKEEELAIQKHTLLLEQQTREQKVAEGAQLLKLQQIQLESAAASKQLESDQQFAFEKAQKDAAIAAERQALSKQLEEAAAKADAARLKVVQEEELARALEKTQAEATRKEAEELANAERIRLVALKKAESEAEALKLGADARATVLAKEVEAQTKAELLRAQRIAEAATVEAKAVKERATAAKDEAAATRAKEAAAGLAKADVLSREAEIEAQRVAIKRDEGIAQAEVAQKLAETETALLRERESIRVQTEQALADLYKTHPALLEIRMLEINNAHSERVAQINADAQMAVMRALAEKMDLRLHMIGGGGNQLTNVIGQLMTLAQGVNLLSNEVPAFGRIMDNIGTGSSVSGSSNGAGNENGSEEPGLAAIATGFIPYIQQVISEVKPRVLSSMSVSDLAEQLVPVLQGKADLLQVLNALRGSVQFQAVGNLPIKPILQMFGLQASTEDLAAVEILQTEEKK